MLYIREIEIKIIWDSIFYLCEWLISITQMTSFASENVELREYSFIKCESVNL